MLSIVVRSMGRLVGTMLLTCASPVVAMSPPSLGLVPPSDTAALSRTRGASKVRARPKSPPPRPAPRVLMADSNVAPPLREALTDAINMESIDNADFGFIAVRLRDGVVLAETGADALINPASNAKLITAAAALDTLHPEYRFKTEYHVDGPLRDGTLQGNLIVKGYGDPTVVSERLARVANELFLLGIEKITGGIIVDGSFFDEVEEARGWELEDAPDRAYAAPVSALTVNHNATSVYIRPRGGGEPAVVRVDPPCEHVVIEGGVGSLHAGRGVRLFSQLGMTPEGTQHTLLTVEGSVGVRDAPVRMYRRVYAPLEHYGSTLAYFLQQRGVQVRHTVTKGMLPPGARLVLVDKSPPLTEVVSDLNHYSNNIIAETLVKVMGAEQMGTPGTFDNGLLVARRFLEEKVGLVPGSYTFENGSGLNDVNRVSARQLAQLLQYMARDVSAGAEFTTSLAVAGTQGTIGFRMRDTPAQRQLRAKTGTLRGVSALSGYVADPNGEPMAFAILAQGFRSGASPIWKVQNAIGVALASDGRWRPEEEGDAEEGAVVSDASPSPVVEMSSGGAP